MTGAVILAAGSGKRMKADRNKQYLLLGGRMLLAHSLSCLGKMRSVDGLILVIRPGDEDMARTALCEAGLTEGDVTLVYGGEERQDSVYQALLAAPEHWQQILIHDGARPLLSPLLIERLLAAADGISGVVPGLPVRDTVKKKEASGQVLYTIPRDDLVLVQTPQLFPLNRLKKGHEAVRRNALAVTDDAAVFEAMNWPVVVVAGEPANLKVTVPEDLPLAEWYLAHQIKEDDR